MADEEQSKGFQVRDRRRFTETGDVRDDAGAETTAPSEPKAEAAAAPPPADHQHDHHGHAQHDHDHHDHDHHGHEDEHLDQPLEITLSTFLMSLSTQALMCLGEIPNPLSGKPEPDFVAVRELIDIIHMLQEKTRGNVDPAEARLFEKILYDLRMRFVEKSRK